LQSHHLKQEVSSQQELPARHITSIVILVTTKFIDIDQNHCLAAKYQQISMVKIGAQRNSEKDRHSENYYEVN
jgi:hypothetical protein